ncbi:MAG: 4-hydroxy-tetrahydrodipicolinate synthase [Clostridiales bacterium]|jgi:4-hydroxy-tetrahydrodipicolinate synthase|nr:4-hydroxy-tetrahydrodipicolinate synthase [Clostridiales bacterium]
MIYKGSATALVTPFNDDKSVNYSELERLVDFQIENGTDALVICGTTGEASTLSDDEQIEVIRTAVVRANHRVPVIGGAGSNDTAHGVELCKRSQAAGADAVVLVTPYYNKTTQKGLVVHYKAMAKAIDIPIVLYNIPGRTGLALEPETIFTLCTETDTIIALKEASGNYEKISRTAQLCADRLDMYSGNDNEILPIMSLGGKGVISTVANVVPKEIHEMTSLFMDGKIEEAAKIQLKLIPLINALFKEVNPIPVKAALAMMGFKTGGYRPPLVEMENANYENLRREMQSVLEKQ